MREVFLDLRATIVELIVLIGVGFAAYWYLRRDAISLTAKLPSVADEAAAIKSIVTKTPSVVSSILRGESDQGYITRQQQAARSAQLLAEKKARAAGLSGAN